MRVIVICLSLCMFFQLPAFASNKSDVLKYGMKGSEVKVIQKYLVDLKYLKKGAANGEFDQNTQDAILRFQREVKLKTDGMVGPATREALQHYKPATKETSKAAKPSPADLKQLVRQKQSENLIRLGMKGQEVKEVQEALIKTGFLTGKADGVYGQATFIAVTNLQKDARLTEDGVVGSKTFLALKANKPVKAPRKNAPNNNKPPAAPKPVLPTLPKVHESYNSDHPANWRSIPLESTAYTRYDEGCTDYTYRGTYLRRGLAAVDPTVIPLGTRLYIPDYGYAVADDIGGAIQGHKIDLAMDTLEEAFDYGRRQITAYIIE